MGTYSSFKDLAKEEINGIDYSVSIVKRMGSKISVIAPHGGKIEPYTAELAEAIAGEEFNLYCFRSLKSRNDLHITSHLFDEPKCISLLKNQAIVIALHGCDAAGERVLLGGLDKKLLTVIAKALKLVGVNNETSGHAFPAIHPTNICNRGAKSAGVQIEMSMKFRKGKNATKLVAALRELLARHQRMLAKGQLKGPRSNC